MSSHNDFNESILSGGGECGEQIRSIDWQNHPLGVPSSWPDALLTTLNLMLCSRFPMFLFWGEELYSFYNDACLPSIGCDGKHPAAMGEKASDMWPELWGTIGPTLEHVLKQGDATFYRDHLLPVKRGDKLETTYWTYSQSPVKDRDGTIRGVFVTAYESTRKVESRQELKKNNRQLREAQQIGEIGSFQFDITNNKLWWSEEMYRIWGVSRKNFDLSYDSILEMMHPVDRGELIGKHQKAIETGEDFELKHRIFLADGQVKWLRVRTRVIENADGVPVELHGISQDITAMQSLQTELEQKAEELLESNRELEQFAYIASHDMKEPLRMISSFMSLLDKNYGSELDDRARKFIHYASDGARRMSVMINDLLEYSRVGRVYSEMENVDTSKVLDDVLRLYAADIEKKNAVIDSENLPVVQGVQVSLKMLFQNLIGNALKYHHADRPPEVVVTAEDAGSVWKFSVSDNGIGIEKKYFEEIFHLFRRLHPAEEYIGSGMGLAICKKIVEQHQGSISLDSEPGKGTTFYFTIQK